MKNILTENQLIKQWANYVNINESENEIQTLLKTQIDPFVEANNYKYYIFVAEHGAEPKSFKEFEFIQLVNDSEELFKTLMDDKSKFINWLTTEHNDHIYYNDDACQDLGITYIDDSDYDREYGHGPAGYYSETDIDNKIEKLIDKVILNTLTDIKHNLNSFKHSNEDNIIDYIDSPSNRSTCEVSKLDNNIFLCDLGFSDIEYTEKDMYMCIGITNYNKE